MNNLSLFLILCLVGFLIAVPTLVDESYASNKQYKVYIEPPPSYAPSGTYQATLDALKFWEKRDNISFVLTAEGKQDIYIKWAKDLDERHVGYAFNQFIEVGLGDGYCHSKWNPFHIDYLRNILTHEVGHAIGYDHESQSNSIMNSGGRDDKHYGTIIQQETMGENWIWSFPICNYDNLADINYIAESNSEYAGFNVYLVPNYAAVENAKAGKDFRQYIQGECVGKNKIRFGGTCSVGVDAWMIIKNGNKFSTVTVTMKEVNIPNKYYKVYAPNHHIKVETIPVPTPKSDDFVTLLGLETKLNGNTSFSNAYDGDVLCLNYSLRDAQRPDFNFSYTVPNEIIYVSKQILDINGNSLTSYTTTGYKMDGSGKFTLCETLEFYSDIYIQNGVRFKAYFAGDNQYDKSNAPTQTIYFEENPVTKYNKELERIRLEQEREMEYREEQQRQQELEDKQREIDYLKKQQKLAEIHEQNVVKLEKQKQEREKLKLEEDQRKELRENITLLKKQSHDRYGEFEKKIRLAEKSLKEISTNTPDAKEYYDEAWDVLKDNKRTLQSLSTKLESGDVNLISNKLDNAIKWYTIDDGIIYKFDGNMEKISTLIEETKKHQATNCFLFWCW